MTKHLALLAAVLLLSCNEDSFQQMIEPPPPSRIVAYVYWDGHGVAGKQIDLVPTTLTRITDTAGIASFDVPAGRYTIRAYGIGTPGPGRPFVNFETESFPGQTTTVGIFDCQACVITTP